MRRKQIELILFVVMLSKKPRQVQMCTILGPCIGSLCYLVTDGLNQAYLLSWCPRSQGKYIGILSKILRLVGSLGNEITNRIEPIYCQHAQGAKERTVLYIQGTCFGYLDEVKPNRIYPICCSEVQGANVSTVDR